MYLYVNQTIHKLVNMRLPLDSNRKMLPNLLSSILSVILLPSSLRRGRDRETPCIATGHKIHVKLSISDTMYLITKACTFLKSFLTCIRCVSI